MLRGSYHRFHVKQFYFEDQDEIDSENVACGHKIIEDGNPMYIFLDKLCEDDRFYQGDRDLMLVVQ